MLKFIREFFSDKFTEEQLQIIEKVEQRNKIKIKKNYASKKHQNKTRFGF